MTINRPVISGFQNWHTYQYRVGRVNTFSSFHHRPRDPKTTKADNVSYRKLMTTRRFSYVHSDRTNPFIDSAAQVVNNEGESDSDEDLEDMEKDYQGETEIYKPTRQRD